MVSGKLKVTVAMGLHLRPAGILCKQATQYESRIQLIAGSNTANAKSVLSVLGACIKTGDELEFICEGPDEEEALRAMIQIVKSGLGE